MTIASLITLHRVLGDASRIRILKLLQEKVLCVSEISSILGLANSTVSQHLLLLRVAGIVRARRDGRWVNYVLNKSIADQSIRSIVGATLMFIETDSMVAGDRSLALKSHPIEVRRRQRSDG